jgi:hypothetical protein
MFWNVIAQIGDDNHYPPLDPKEARFVATIDKPGDSHGIAHDLLSEVLKAGLLPCQVAIDLLHVEAIIHTADLRTARSIRSRCRASLMPTARRCIPKRNLWPPGALI